MQEIMVRVFRAIACRTRLRMFARLAGAEELTPTELARVLHIGRDLVCAHAARFSAAGLIKRRRSGSRCYCIAESPYSRQTLSGEVCAWLRDALRAPTSVATGRSHGGGRGSVVSASSADAERAVFEAVTTFANLRRLMILRHLADGRSADAPELVRELKMSMPAVNRQIGKLVRRGYVRAVASGKRTRYQLVASGKSPLHARLFEIVSAQWDDEVFQS